MSYRLISAFSKNATSYLTSGRCLLLTPHPDDETLGCGELIIRKRQAGEPVHIVFATDGDGVFPESSFYTPSEPGSVRRKEAIGACRIFGVPKEAISFLGLADGSLSEKIETLALEIKKQIEKFHPDQVLVPCWADYQHPDHLALHKAAMLVKKDHPDVHLIEYTVWFWNARWWWPWIKLILLSISDRFRGHRTDRPCIHPWKVPTEPFQSQKEEALFTHASQFQKLSGRYCLKLMEDVLLNACLHQSKYSFRKNTQIILP